MKGGKKAHRIKPGQPRMSRHHIIPLSRSGSNADDNVFMIPQKKHELYHQMFGNMTPVEIMHHLNGVYWKGLYGICMHLIREEDIEY